MEHLLVINTSAMGIPMSLHGHEAEADAQLELHFYTRQSQSDRLEGKTDNGCWERKKKPCVWDCTEYMAENYFIPNSGLDTTIPSQWTRGTLGIRPLRNRPHTRVGGLTYLQHPLYLRPVPSPLASPSLVDPVESSGRCDVTGSHSPLHFGQFSFSGYLVHAYFCTWVLLQVQVGP
jgi:hypothetical protein